MNKVLLYQSPAKNGNLK